MKDQVETLIRQGKFQKYVRKTEPHKYQRKDDQDRTQGAGDSKPAAGEIKTISEGLTAGKTLKSLKKAYGKEINNVHSWLPPMKLLKNDKPNIVFLEKNSRSFRQPYDNPLVIMFKVEEFTSTRCLLTMKA